MTYRIIYLPYGKEDKEWMDIEADSKEEALTKFKSGILISIR